jgi:mycothiol synthase
MGAPALETSFPLNFGSGMDLRRIPAEIAPCPLYRRGDALAFLYRDTPAPLRDRLVDDALRIPPDRQEFLAATRNDRIVGAIRARLATSQVAIIHPPEVASPPGRSLLAAALVRGMLELLRGRGIRLAQGVAEGERAAEGSRSLEAGGLACVTSLARWDRCVREPISLPAGTPAIHWERWTPEAEPAFAEALEASYEGSLDIPELDGFRPYEVVRDCFRDAGQFDPGRWWLGRPEGSAGVPGRPDALILLLALEGARGSGLGLTYLGLTPAARGRGLGFRALADLVEFAADRGFSHLTLNVDARNGPALKLYRRAGFAEVSRAALHLARLDGDQAPP